MEPSRTITIHVPGEIATEFYGEIQKSFDAILSNVVAPFLQGVVQETFETEGGSQGDRWSDLHPGGIKMRKRRGVSIGNPILQSSGTLLKHAMDIRSIDNTSVFIGPPEDLVAPYPEKAATKPGYWKAVQANDSYPRVFMSVTNKQWEQLLAIIEDFIRNTLQIPGITATFSD